MSDKNNISNKNRNLNEALEKINKQFGVGSVMRLGDNQTVNIQTTSTGSLAVDLALGVGGLPKGRVIEIFGPEASGKTTLALHCVAQCQKTGGTAAFIDAEHALDKEYASRLGVKCSELLVSQPDTGEQALEIADTLIRSNSIDLIVIDSVAALTPKAEIDGEMGDNHIGLQARLMSQALRKMTSALSTSGTTAIFINQLRDKIGVMFGSPETTTGGKALKFYSTIRIDIRRIAAIKEGDKTIGNRTAVKIVKNKVAPPFQRVEFDIIYGLGISNESSILDIGTDLGIVEKSGTWYTYKDSQLGQGKSQARQLLVNRPDIAEKIMQEINQKLNQEKADKNDKFETDKAKTDKAKIATSKK
ncbi:MAG: recombinase RecA [Bifidobacteriaceae bacterium]|jgi:recombination protein RecA|nr:recombinase RecA [Bifidobacteriaceae bacterium]